MVTPVGLIAARPGEIPAMARAAEEQTSQPPEMRRPLSLTIPCKAEYVALCRLVIGALGAHEALDGESIADLKVVVTEACNCFLGEPEEDGLPCTEEAQPEPGTDDNPLSSLRVDFYVSSDVWEIVVSNPDRQRRISPTSLCEPMSGGGLGLTIIQALVDSMERTDDEVQGSIIRLLKRVPTRLTTSD
jgi:hypothetical protein